MRYLASEILIQCKIFFANIFKYFIHCNINAHVKFDISPHKIDNLITISITIERNKNPISFLVVELQNLIWHQFKMGSIRGSLDYIIAFVITIIVNENLVIFMCKTLVINLNTADNL